MINCGLRFGAFHFAFVVMSHLPNAELICDEFPKPHIRRVVVPLVMPRHPQDEGRQSERLGTGRQVEALAEFLNNRFLETRHQVARCDGVQHGETMRQRQSEATPKSSCGQLVIDKPP